MVPQAVGTAKTLQPRSPCDFSCSAPQPGPSIRPSAAPGWERSGHLCPTGDGNESGVGFGAVGPPTSQPASTASPGTNSAHQICVQGILGKRASGMAQPRPVVKLPPALGRVGQTGRRG